jgi:hypothetical protein
MRQCSEPQFLRPDPATPVGPDLAIAVVKSPLHSPTLQSSIRQAIKTTTAYDLTPIFDL